MMRPRSTYRLQITSDFDLHAATAVAEYIHSLGADWLYLSPLLTAANGSTHGYDVIDHSHVDAARGGAEGLATLAAEAKRLGMGVLVDIVPNHIGIATPRDNPWFWDVLLHGPASPYAEAFDIDWAAGDGKVLIPILADEKTDDITINGDTIRYFDHTFPIAPGTAEGDAATVLARQHYRLLPWRRGDAELNYRRFFTVNTLAGIRVEVPWVFEQSHAEIVRWVDEGLVTGLRVDHPDGLADPGGYLDALAEATGGVYVVVEKILQRDEEMPTSWRTDGTTGYDALGDFDRVLIDPAGRPAFEEIAASVGAVDEPASWRELVHHTKRAVADGALRAEVRRIARELPESTHVGEREAQDAIAELLACFPVYRSYLPLGRAHMESAFAEAAERRSDLVPALQRLRAVLFDAAQPATQRFQQTSGMVMAKGVEDYAFYRFPTIGTLTEVGGDPSEFAIGVAEFHRRQQRRCAAWPASQTALTTHDTKRSEDVRARLAVLAEVPDEWVATSTAIHARAPIEDRSFEQLLWQAVVGAWPASRERIHAYAVKAAREAGRSTSWTDPSNEFEQHVRDAVDRAYDDPVLERVIADFVGRIEHAGWSNSLSSKLLQLLAPGVPDVYQGTEVWEPSLVDPDNRRPVDFERRRAMLADLDAGRVPAIDRSGAAKLLVTSRALRLRRDHPELFLDYRPLEVLGTAAEHMVAFDRGGAVALATRLPLGLQRRGGWNDTVVALARRRWVDLLTDRVVEGGLLRVADVLDELPVALLAPDEVVRRR